MTAKAQTQSKQVEATTTNKRAAAKKPAAPKKPTTSAVKKAVSKVSAGVKAKAAAPKKPTTKKPITKKPSTPKAKVEAPAAPAVSPQPEKLVVEAWSVTGKPIVRVEAPEQSQKQETKVETETDLHEAEKEAKIAAVEEMQALASNCTKVEKLLEFLLISKKLQVDPPHVTFCNDLTNLLSDCLDQDGKLKISVKPINPRGGKKTQSKVNGSSALRAFWAELIDRPEGATREELFEGGKENFPDLSPKTMMSQMSQLRLGYDYGVSIHPEYSGRKASEINGVYTWLPAEETKLEDYRIAKKEKTVGGIEMIGSDGRVWAGVQKVG
jgi:hypothetical protein